MSRYLAHLIAAGFLCLLSAGTVRAESASPAETRLREALRATMIQLRTAQTEQATLQAAQAQSTEENKNLTDKVKALTKQCKEDKEVADKTISDMKAKTADQEAQLAQLKADLEKSQAAYQQAAEMARAKEGERAKLASDLILRDRVIADQKTKNAAMYQLGNEILTRYEKFGLGTALSAKEPFTGITRVKFQNYIQDYQDKLADQKIKPAQ